MRTIKFRGKRLDNGTWETGGIAPLWIGTSRETWHIVDKVTGYLTPVDPTTVGQFTGLLDKNGVEIYEGDIANHTIHPQIYYGTGKDDYTIHKGLVCKYEVQYNALQVSFEIKCIYVSKAGVQVGSLHKTEIAIGDRLAMYSIDGYTPKCKFEIIGNIHDNPELLKNE